MAEVSDNHSDFVGRGEFYQLAWGVLHQGCEVPLSLEVFDYMLAETRKTRPSLGVVDFARMIVAGYHRHVGLF